MRKTTKWKYDAFDELRKICIDCELHLQMARKGGKTSKFLNTTENTEIKLDKIFYVSKFAS